MIYTKQLDCLEHLTINFSEEHANAPPDDFWFGFSIILWHINDNIKSAIEKFEKKDKENDQKQKPNKDLSQEKK